MARGSTSVTTLRGRVHGERHGGRHTGWLRAAVLGANDGILSTAGLVIGVVAAHADRGAVLAAGTAGLVAGAMSMAAGEYVSVSSQSDSEHADLERERHELASDLEYEHRELATIYVHRGVEPALARQVADQLMAKDALGAHARDELGIVERGRARPLQAALTSAATFAVGALLPLLTAAVAPLAWMTPAVAATSLALLATLGGLAAYSGGAPVGTGALRVSFWGALAMIFTAAVGTAFGTALS